MKSEVPALSQTPHSLDELLNSAVVLNWEALTQSSTAGRVRVEYHIGADGALEYLKLWNTAREYWSLVCEFSAHLGWSDGPRFLNGYHSRSLSRLLQSIMMNQKLGIHGSNPNSNGILEVGPPSTEDIEFARVRVTEAFPPAAATRGNKRTGEVQLLPAQS